MGEDEIERSRPAVDRWRWFVVGLLVVALGLVAVLAYAYVDAKASLDRADSARARLILSEYTDECGTHEKDDDGRPVIDPNFEHWISEEQANALVGLTADRAANIVRSWGCEPFLFEPGDLRTLEFVSNVISLHVRDGVVVEASLG